MDTLVLVPAKSGLGCVSITAPSATDIDSRHVGNVVSCLPDTRARLACGFGPSGRQQQQQHQHEMNAFLCLSA